jgi:hypothetical protein
MKSSDVNSSSQAYALAANKKKKESNSAQITLDGAKTSETNGIGSTNVSDLLQKK